MASIEKHYHLLKRWLPLFVIWLWRPYWLWLGTLAIVLASAAPFYFECFERATRLGGMVLQLIGFGLLARLAYGTAKSLGKEPVSASIRSWRDSFPTYWPPGVTIVLPTVEATVTGYAPKIRARLHSSPSERIEALEQRSDQFEDRLDEMDAALRTHRDETKAGFERERTHRDAADEIVASKFTEVLTGDLHVELIGIVLFFVGVLYASASQEAATLFGQPMSCPSPFW